ncbi:MAG: hypothetical protein ACI89T_002226 [Cognaticolwellia sp.]|jgi:hypothetical protein
MVKNSMHYDNAWSFFDLIEAKTSIAYQNNFTFQHHLPNKIP